MWNNEIDGNFLKKTQLKLWEGTWMLTAACLAVHTYFLKTLRYNNRFAIFPPVCWEDLELTEKPDGAMKQKKLSETKLQEEKMKRRGLRKKNVEKRAIYQTLTNNLWAIKLGRLRRKINFSDLESFVNRLKLKYNEIE